MMPAVTVDADDLETLLFSVNAIQGVEAALKARERDPLVLAKKGRISEAHDRLAAQWRRAKRPEPEAPTEADILQLRAMFPEGKSEAMVKEFPTRLVQVLQFVEAGPIWHGIKIDWPAPAAPEFRQMKSFPQDLQYAARLMPRGEAALRQRAEFEAEGGTVTPGGIILGPRR